MSKALHLNFCRNALFTPGNKIDLYKKALASKEMDAVVFDWEDAVPIAEKEEARNALLHHLSQTHLSESVPVVIRINSIETLDGLKDLFSLTKSSYKPDAIMLPKVQHIEHVKLYSILLNRLGSEHTPLIATIETAYGLQYAHEIASHPDVIALVFGGADLTSEIGATLSYDSTVAYRARVVQAAHYAGKQAWDVPYLDFKDTINLKKEAQAVKALGFSAKLAIHPLQLKTIATVFSPSHQEIQDAQKILKIFHHARGHACEHQGKMLDSAVINKSEKLLQKAQFIKRQGNE